MESRHDITARAFEFGIAVLDSSEQIPASRIGNRIADQLIRSGTSIGANLEEATAAASTADFANKVITALKEARETSYWLRVVQRKQLTSQTSVEALLKESEEIKKILGSIVSKV